MIIRRESLNLRMLIWSFRFREEMDGHLDTVQSELDNLRDVLRNEGCSIDATTLLGVRNTFYKQKITLLCYLC